MQKLLTFFQQKFQHICISLDLTFNESLTNDVVSFEQLGPDDQTDMFKFQDKYSKGVQLIRLIIDHPLFSGFLASKFGGKYLFGGGVFVTAIFTLLTPLCARWNVYLLITVRVLEGLCEVNFGLKTLSYNIHEFLHYPSLYCSTILV